MKKLALLVFLLFPLHLHLHSESLKDKNYGNIIVSEVVSIYDADTFRVNIKDWPDLLGYRISIRLNGVDAPEMRGKCPKEKQLARQAKQITVAFLRASNVIELRNMRRGKYFRILADVYGDGKSLADHLISKTGFVREYSGGSRAGWCD